MKLRFFWKFIVMKKVMPDGYGKSHPFLYAALFLLFFSGCGNKFFDPSQVGRFRPVPAVNVILDSLGVAEEAPAAWEGAEEPLPVIMYSGQAMSSAYQYSSCFRKEFNTQTVM